MDLLMIAKGWALSGVAVLVAEAIGNLLKYATDQNFRKWVDSPRGAADPRRKVPGWFGVALFAVLVVGWPVLLGMLIHAWRQGQTGIERFCRAHEEKDAKIKAALADLRRKSLDKAQRDRVNALERLKILEASREHYLQLLRVNGTDQSSDFLILVLIKNYELQIRAYLEAIDSELEKK